MEVKNAIAIISGGASGMGAATAHKLAQAGAKVIVLDINLEAAKTLAHKIKGNFLACDVTDVHNIETVIANIVSTYGPPQICVNCAGIITAHRMIDKRGLLPPEMFQQVITVNLTGTFNLMRSVAAAMIAQNSQASGERGIIINTASIAAFEGQIGQIAYSASKGGIVSMTLPAARELAQWGIRVMAVAPGLVDTPMFANLSQEAKQALIAAVPFPKRLAHPDEFAKLVQHIIENPMLNGCCIRLDGALRMQPK